MKNRVYCYFARIVITIGPPIAILGLMFMLLAWPAMPVHAATIIVDRATGSDTSTCGSEPTPCWSVSYAVTQRAVSGDIVSVLAGTYTETVAMRAGVIISGEGSSVTFIDGEGVRGPMVSAGSGITESAILRGITIRRGSADYGGGLSIAGGASPIIEDCVISDGQATLYGGGVYVNASSPVFSNTQVLSNTAVRGGGIYVDSSASPILDAVTVSYNRATGTGYGSGGGGIYVAGSLALTGTQVISNTASENGGGVYQFAESGWLSWVGGRLERNVAEGHGGGVYVGGDLILTGTLVLSNTAATWGGGLCVEHNVTMTDVQVIDNIAGQWGAGLYQSVLFVDHVSISSGRFENNMLTWTNSVGGALFSSSPLTIIGTEVISNYAYEGGGLHGSSSMTLTGVHVFSNTAMASGGGLDQNWLGGDDIAFWVYATDTRFEDNIALTGDGGAIRVAGNAALTQTQVISNSASGLGGGMYVEYDVVLSDTQILSNTAGTSGGGIYQSVAGRQVIGTGGRIAYNVAANGGGGGLYTRGALTLSGTQILTNTCSQWGGGVILSGASANANLSQVNLIGNCAAESGGGLYVGDASAQVTVTGGLWKDNVAEARYPWNGGGGACVYGSLVMTGTQVVNNTVAGIGIGGGGLYAEQGVRIVNALFAANTATDGAGVYLVGTAGSQELLHLTIVSSTVGSGSAIYVYSGTAGITNTIIVSHTTGVFAYSGAAVTVNGVLWFGNTANTGGAGSINVTYARTGEPAFAADGYHLTVASPAIDWGVDSGIAVDIDGDARPQNGVYDLGADEYVPQYYTLTIAQTGTGNGMITPTVGTHEYVSGTIALVTATAQAGSTFSGWSGACGDTTPTCTVTMDTSKLLTATFMLNTYIITPTAGAGGSIMPGTPQTVNHGGSQAFSIAASSGYHIVDVGVDGVSQGVLASYTFENVMANHTITAAFALEAGPTAPAVPTLLAPPNGIVTTTQSLTLSWQPASTGGMPDGYNVLLDGVTITTTNTTLPTVLAAGIHTWTVRAFNGGGYSAWTASWTVTVEAYRIYLPLVLRNTP